MSRKSVIMLGMVVGSIGGGYCAGLFGASGFSMAYLLGSFIGAIVGIWVGYKIS
jgi:uncharacterized membrane protein YeaQ/YmgE (transglycosylase-associated protein family)